jgi:chorismate--pyruvate lyase
MLKTGKEPPWRPVTAALRRKLSPGLASWLMDTESLTRRLQAVCGREFHVSLCAQHWQRPLSSERDILMLPGHVRALVRQVCLMSGERALVYARTVMPAAMLQGSRRRYARLGTRSLGSMLFTSAGVVRGPLEAACLRAGHTLYADALAHSPQHAASLWGRRSVFLVQGYPLLVTEVFLPTLLGSGARSGVRRMQ